MSKSYHQRVFERVHITGIADKGRGVGRYEGEVVFVEGAVPGDVVQVSQLERKKGCWFGRIAAIVEASPHRITAPCAHFGVCGGCKWQHLEYTAQLHHKQLEVTDALTRIGKVEVGSWGPIIGASQVYGYRNKLEFTASNRRWLTDEEIRSEERFDRSGVGFHLPGHFDKVLDVAWCHLQPEPSNALRLAIKSYVLERSLDFYDLRQGTGWLRNITVRTSSTGQVMCTIVLGNDVYPQHREGLCAYLIQQFPGLTSLNYVINPKANDSIFDRQVVNVYGLDHIEEVLDGVRYRISAKSFFQTNTQQAVSLYRLVTELAGLRGSETVYDLYTGTGSIACFIARQAGLVVGIEEVDVAVDDARQNALLNGLTNVHFYAGDVKDLLTRQLLDLHGAPDVVITDPPRAGMHEHVVRSLLEVAPERIVYVSCNPATQARDLHWLSERYRVRYSQAVDMFPHTQHVENVVLLERW